MSVAPASSSSSSAPATADIPPNHTIYINNINEKVKKEDLKKNLYALFSRFGSILDVVALRTYRMRGQAWIVFKDIAAAGAAMREMQGYTFFDKPIKISYALTKSDAVAQLDGTFSQKQKEDRKKTSEKKRAADRKDATSKRVAMGLDGANSHLSHQPRDAPPNRILFVEGLPEGVADSTLSALFTQFPGFREVRLVPGRSGIAFVEYDSELQSSAALAGLQNFKINSQDSMIISYAKR
eukprot:TRINITY_DN16425_c0_g1_i1.p1 TRINITY_DN16425_c0_g1~~TRINITY_DN16425_c0_g1_i1.p1  ORF type:complete len:273 (-),score=62.36 TRINITY_DN16425_c0_g1_i1:42-758(-)